LRINGADLASSASPMYGVYVRLEAFDDNFSKRHFPDDPTAISTPVSAATRGRSKLNCDTKARTPTHTGIATSRPATCRRTTGRT
jgi:hypothetical protein